MAELLRITVNWDAVDHERHLPPTVARFVGQLRVGRRATTWGTTYVYHSCGSCTDDPDDNRQLVEVYEDDGGSSSKPDWYYREDC